MGYHDPATFSQSIDVVDERRAYPRFRVALQGVSSIAGGVDETCTVVDLSLGGAKVTSTGKAVVGAKISLLLPHVGLLDARVVRMTEDGFGIAFTGSVAQRRRIQGYLVISLELQDDHALEDRAFDRIVPLRRTVEVHRADARSHMARIQDVSRSGVALTTTIAMSVGENILVGGTAAEVVRVFDGGAAARFETLLAPTFDATITL